MSLGIELKLMHSHSNHHIYTQIYVSYNVKIQGNIWGNFCAIKNEKTAP